MPKNWNCVLDNPQYLAGDSVFLLTFLEPVTEDDLDIINSILDSRSHGKMYVVMGLSIDEGLKDGEYLTARVTCIGS